MDWTTIIGYLITPITGIIGWVAGTRQRRNTAIQALQETIKQQADTIREYNDRILQLMNEVQEVRRENAELKAGQELLLKQIEQLKIENKQLNEILKNKKTTRNESHKTQLSENAVSARKDD